MSALIDFSRNYAESGVTRFHMPGHKGTVIHGLEALDITEIKGADFLFESQGIIADGEKRSARLFGSQMTCWSTEGSSLSIKAALLILRWYVGHSLRIASPRNCHRAFLNGCVLLDIEPEWLWSDEKSRLCECSVTAQSVEQCIRAGNIDAVYITSPDYLGNIADIAAIAEVCHRYGVFLICDNAHGAYLKLLEPSRHPLDLGADIVCDSAHKTFPVYTGGAYLHISRNAPEKFSELAKKAMEIFASTSPSYLIMQSLDMCNDLLEKDLPVMIRNCCERVSRIKALMNECGMSDLSAEPMKICIDARRYGYNGRKLAELMREKDMECEYSDPDVVVLMFSPYNTEQDFIRLEEFIHTFEKSTADAMQISENLAMIHPEKVMSLRETFFSETIKISVKNAYGSVCARTAMSCQPSVAIVMAGERICKDEMFALEKYGIDEIEVIRR